MPVRTTLQIPIKKSRPHTKKAVVKGTTIHKYRSLPLTHYRVGARVFLPSVDDDAYDIRRIVYTSRSPMVIELVFMDFMDRKAKLLHCHSFRYTEYSTPSLDTFKYNTTTAQFMDFARNIDDLFI